MNAVARVFPDCEHRYCKRHLLANMATAGYRGEKYKSFVDSAVYAYTEYDYNRAMDALKAFNAKAWKWLNYLGKEHFSRHAFSSRSRIDLVVNNLSEVFNNYIIEFRDKPIVTMLDKIRQKLMVRVNQKRDGGQQAMWEITPVVVGKLEVEKKYARYCNAYQSGVGLWEILGSERQYEVNLFSRTCGCNKWQLTGIPCKHAVTAIFAAKERPEDYVDEHFRKEAYLRAYAPVIYPVPGEHDWTTTDSPDIDPPKFTKQPGRPKKSRRRGQDEAPKVTGRARMTTTTCTNCEGMYHNYTTCKKKLRPDLQIRLDALKAILNFSFYDLVQYYSILQCCNVCFFL